MFPAATLPVGFLEEAESLKEVPQPMWLTSTLQNPTSQSQHYTQKCPAFLRLVAVLNSFSSTQVKLLLCGCLSALHLGTLM